MELFYQRDGKTFWKCSWCARERENPTASGSYVKVGNAAIGIVCTEACEAPTSLALVDLLERQSTQTVRSWQGALSKESEP